MRAALAFQVLLMLALPVSAFEIYFLDTEGGAATLMLTDARESILVDTGNPGGRDAKRIFDAAQAAGVKQIDHLITTHYHIDHFGGAAELAKLMPVRTVYDNGTFEGGWEKPSKEYALMPVDKRVVLNPGDTVPLKQAEGAPKSQLQCIAARKQTMPPPPGAAPFATENPKRKADDKSDNANSITLLLSVGDFRFFLAGDLTWNIEEKLVNPVNLVGWVDLYQVTHHGLDVSNNPLVINALKPTVAVMMNGIKKGCGPETVAALRACKSIQAIWQIHKSLRDDSATVNTAPEFIANPDEKCQNHFIKVALAADARSYTVGIPAHKVEKKYDVAAK